MQPSERLDRIPPYLFAELERKIAAKKAAGVDVISLGIGDPDRPTPALIVDAMQEAVSEAETHHYPSNRGRPEFREAVSDFYERRFGIEDIDQDTEVIPALGAKECIFNLNLAFLDPGDIALASDPGYPVYTGTAHPLRFTCRSSPTSTSRSPPSRCTVTGLSAPPSTAATAAPDAPVPDDIVSPTPRSKIRAVISSSESRRQNETLVRFGKRSVLDSMGAP